MKILFVEDELPMHIPTMLDIFSQGIGSQLRKEIQNLSDDEQNYGVTTDEIREILNRTNYLDIADSFPGALDIIKNYASDYDMFIVDRNLEKEMYTFEEIQEIDSNFTEKIYNDTDYLSREGDWLLHALLYNENNIDIKEQFYFLTAYDDDIKSMDRGLLDQSGFDPEKQIIKKGDLDSISKLKKKIKSYPAFKFAKENKEILEIIRSRIGADAEKSYTGIAKNSDNTVYINQIRQFFENHIIKTFVNQGIVPKDKCYKKYTNSQGEESLSNYVFIKGFIDYIHPIRYKKDEEGNFEFDDQNEKTFDGFDYNQFHSNQFIRSEMYTINYIGHPASHESQYLTKDTALHVFTALKDIIRWFEVALKQFETKEAVIEKEDERDSLD